MSIKLGFLVENRGDKQLVKVSRVWQMFREFRVLASLGAELP